MSEWKEVTQDEAFEALDAEKRVLVDWMPVVLSEDRQRMVYESGLKAFIGRNRKFRVKLEPALQLREGAWYERRDGEVRGPAKRRDNIHYRWAVDGGTYSDDGYYYCAADPHPMLDLIKEVPAPVEEPEYEDWPIMATGLFFVEPGAHGHHWQFCVEQRDRFMGFVMPVDKIWDVPWRFSKGRIIYATHVKMKKEEN